MEKTRESYPEWDTQSTYKPVSWTYPSIRSGRSIIIGRYERLIDSTPPYKGVKYPARPKRAKKLNKAFDIANRARRHGKQFSEIWVEGKQKVRVAKTRKSEVSKNYPKYVFKGIVKRSIMLTRNVEHLKVECIPHTIEGNDSAEYFTDAKAASYYGTDGFHRVENMFWYYSGYLKTRHHVISQAIGEKSKEWLFDVPLVQKIVQNCLPRPEQFFPACNLIAVLVELKPSLAMAKQTAGLLKNVINHFSSKANRTAGRLLDSAAETRLWANFGVSPTGNDIAAILSLLFHFRTMVETYNKEARLRIYTIHRTILRTDIDKLDLGEGNLLYAPVHFAGESARYLETVEDTKAEVVGKLTVKIRLKPLSATWSARVLEKLLGFDDFLLGLWEGVPFSWLVDYFTNASSIIEFYTSTDLVMPYEIIDASYSVEVNGTAQVSQIAFYEKSDYITQRLLRKNGKTWYKPGETVYKGFSHKVKGQVEFRFKHYRRQNITDAVRILAKLPGQPLQFKLKRPSFNQALNAASVGYLKARGKNLNYRRLK